MLLVTIKVNFSCDVENSENEYKKKRSSTVYSYLLVEKVKNLFKLIKYFSCFLPTYTFSGFYVNPRNFPLSLPTRTLLS